MGEGNRRLVKHKSCPSDADILRWLFHLMISAVARYTYLGTVPTMTHSAHIYFIFTMHSVQGHQRHRECERERKGERAEFL